MFAMSSGLLDPTRRNVPLNYAHANVCPCCGSDVMVWLPQLHRIDDERDEYGCRKCGEAGR
jgi:hypothetical protein